MRRPPLVLQEMPDVDTASEEYARRFRGAAGEYFLRMQAAAIEHLIRDLRGASVLEVGGGHGQLIPTLLRNGCSLTILGSTDSAHERVRRRHYDAAIRFDSGDLLNLPYEDGSFDVAVAVRLIAHIESWERLLAELCRASRTAVVIDFPSWRSLNALTPLLFRFKKCIEGNTRAYRSFLPSQLNQSFQRHGFTVSASYAQFFLPMFVHRGLSGACWLQHVERACRDVGLTSLLGSPVLLRADRSSGRD